MVYTIIGITIFLSEAIFLAPVTTFVVRRFPTPPRGLTGHMLRKSRFAYALVYDMFTEVFFYGSGVCPAHDLFYLFKGEHIVIWEPDIQQFQVIPKEFFFAGHGSSSFLFLAAHSALTGEPVADLKEMAVLLDYTPENGVTDIILHDLLVLGCFLHDSSSSPVQVFIAFITIRSTSIDS